MKFLVRGNGQTSTPDELQSSRDLPRPTKNICRVDWLGLGGPKLAVRASNGPRTFVKSPDSPQKTCHFVSPALGVVGGVTSRKILRSRPPITPANPFRNGCKADSVAIIPTRVGRGNRDSTTKQGCRAAGMIGRLGCYRPNTRLLATRYCISVKELSF